MGQARTWGPFTGRQLTTIVVALMATVVLVPGAVWAATTFTNVVIQDAASGKTATVNNNGQLGVIGNVASADRTIVVSNGVKDPVEFEVLVPDANVKPYRTLVVLLRCSPHGASTDCGQVEVDLTFGGIYAGTTHKIELVPNETVALDFPNPRGTTLRLTVDASAVQSPVMPTIAWTVLGRAN